MTKKIGKLARRYARAFLSVVIKELGQGGAEGNPPQQVAESLLRFAEIWSEDRELQRYLLSPMFEKGQRLRALSEIGKAAGLPEVTNRFLRVVFERDRLSQLDQIALAFSILADEVVGTVKVEIITAQSIDAIELKQIETDLARQVRGLPEFIWKVDPSLIGGMVIKFEGKVLDGSISRKLERIEKSLV